MKLFETVRSWSFPPAYSALPNENEQTVLSTAPPVHIRHNISRVTRPNILTYLLDFSKQWLLVHVLTIFSSFALMFTGAAVFVTRPLSFSNGDEVKFAWLCSATSMICAVIDGIAFGALRKLETANLGLTVEQQGTRSFVTTTVAALGQLAVAAMMVAVAMGAPQNRDWMGLLKFIAFLAATLNVVSCVYDIVKQSQSRQESEDDWGPDDLDDEVPRHTGRASGAIHL
ncbi:hypothetical protein B0A48_17376 [Cryoendolithus antarcticus]|uniref:MARVEL domain-containing protein n=1 Tax=Cryoendolithus antarcticus TaxID=1507870 RepID=A0A1V8SCF0_9PEZI|nr:hypothetical protein B0A48_17376 [Cryoendolithus antarcticus]